LADIRLTWKGEEKLQRFLRDSPREALQATRKSLNESGEQVMTEAKRVTPVDTGTLRGSGHVKSPTVTRTRVEVILGFGGAASAYALYQHERTDLNHPGQGQAKYLERPFNAATSRIQRKLASDLKRAMR